MARAGAPEGYETSDLRVRMTVLIAAGGVVVLALSLVGLLWFYHWLLQAERPPRPPFAGPALEKIVPPQPRLLAQPAQELRQRLGEQRHRLETYGWVDEKTGVAHIPIERAITLLLKQGWPGDPGGPEQGGAAARPLQAGQ